MSASRGPFRSNTSKTQRRAIVSGAHLLTVRSGREGRLIREGREVVCFKHQGGILTVHDDN